MEFPILYFGNLRLRGHVEESRNLSPPNLIDAGSLQKSPVKKGQRPHLIALVEIKLAELGHMLHYRQFQPSEAI